MKPASGCEKILKEPCLAALNDLFDRMKEAFSKERAAIINMDEDNLRKNGVLITDLFCQMVYFMNRAHLFEPAALQGAAKKLSEVRCLREENSRLLQEALKETGLKIKQNSAHFQAARVYEAQGIKKALFIKKDC